MLSGKPGPLCPEVLEPEQVVLIPRGFGPVRNIVAFIWLDIEAHDTDLYRRLCGAAKAQLTYRPYSGTLLERMPPSR